MKKVILLVTVFALIFACSSSSDEGSASQGGNVDGFNRGEMLTHWADNIIIPALEDLDTKLKTLKTNKDSFIATPNKANLDAVKTSWLQAYKVWQHVEMFNIGKSEELNFVFQMNVYPTNATDIEANVSSGSYDLSSVGNNDAVGFPAVEYMLYGVASNETAILAKYSDTKYKTYLSDLVNQMVSLNSSVLSNWKDVYRAIFVVSTSNTATSAVNKLTNDFVYYFEKGFRANKIGIPAGVFSAGKTFKDKVEGYHSKVYSKELALEALDAVQNFFNGKSYGKQTSGASFASYINALNRPDLVQTVSTRLNDSRTKINDIQADFSAQVESDNTKMTKAYDQIQKALVPFKVDMLQVFNISVDYVDADGD